MNQPPTEKDTVNMTGEYSWSQNAKIICSATIDSIYNKDRFWRKKFFLLLSETCGKRNIEKIKSLLNEWALKNISFKTIMIMPNVFLQNPSKTFKSKKL